MKLLGLMLFTSATPLVAATLQGFASLPADTLMPGPDSGHFISPLPSPDPYFQGQPAQGFSALVRNEDGGYLALSDNGFGKRENSADFLLRIYFIEVDFRTAQSGSGEIRIEGFITLNDPNHRIGFPLSADTGFYAGSEPPLPMHPSIIDDRLLTGADLDPESMQMAPDGSLWIGDEFGPYLVQLSQDGMVLEEAFTLDGLQAEGCTVHCRGEATLPGSKGFEGMAMPPSGNFLYPMLEGPMLEAPGQLNIYTFDLEAMAFVNSSAAEPSYRYRIEPEATAIGAFTMFSETGGLVLERDSGEAGEASHKKVFRIDFERTGDDGFLLKEEIADLMSISDPHDLNRDGDKLFSFPFHTPEGLLVLDRNTIGIINDNNFPFGRGRGDGKAAEGTEFIMIAVADLW